MHPFEHFWTVLSTFITHARIHTYIHTYTQGHSDAPARALLDSPASGVPLAALLIIIITSAPNTVARQQEHDGSLRSQPDTFNTYAFARSRCRIFYPASCP